MIIDTRYLVNYEITPLAWKALTWVKPLTIDQSKTIGWPLSIREPKLSKTRSVSATAYSGYEIKIAGYYNSLEKKNLKWSLEFLKC